MYSGPVQKYSDLFCSCSKKYPDRLLFFPNVKFNLEQFLQVHNMTHPQLMHRLLSCGNELTVHVVPLTNTSIKEGEPRRNVGKPLRKKPLRRPTTNLRGGGGSNGAGGNGRVKGGGGGGGSSAAALVANSSLLRRLSGKRGNAVDIVPGKNLKNFILDFFEFFRPRKIFFLKLTLMLSNSFKIQFMFLYHLLDLEMFPENSILLLIFQEHFLIK